MASTKADQTFDIVIIGAGISGINAAYRVQELCPGKSYTILEGRDQMGGTWDLFKYPGIRSDSDLHTFGFPFRPWQDHNAIADGHRIIKYMEETAAEFGIDRNIQYGHTVDSCDFSTKRQRWDIKATTKDGRTKVVRSQFLFFATGYYDYHEPLETKIPGISNFKGEVIHPQFWPENYDYTDKNIVIIGSGATAVTLFPNLAEKAAKVTMLQRSPSWIVAVPQNDAISRFFRWLLPRSWAGHALRYRFLFLYWMSYNLFQTFPNFARNVLRRRTQQLLPKGYPMDPNFNPRYNPWDQRLCASPDGDFYAAIRGGKADVVTGTIKTISANTITLENKTTLKPDVIITATGLKLRVAGGCKITIDGQVHSASDKHVYRHAMLENIPNSVTFIGYVQYSWTLGSDVSARWVCRLINYMQKNGYESATPVVQGELNEAPLLALKSTYIEKGGRVLPKGGDRDPWAPRRDYWKDLKEAQQSDFSELEFVKAPAYKDEK